MEMTFDDQLKQAFETLSDRLRAELDRQVAGVMDELSAAARSDVQRAVDTAREAATRDAAGVLDSAVAEARQQAHAEAKAEGREQGVREGLEEGRRQGIEDGRQQGIAEGREQGLAEGREQGLAEGREQGLAEGRERGLAEGREQGLVQGRQQGIQEGRQQAEEEGRAAIAAAVAAAQAERPAPLQTGGSERLAGAVGMIGRARSLSEVLDALRNCAAREAAHADVWLVRGGQLRKWRAAADEPALPVEHAATIGDAIRSASAVVAGREVAVPIVMAGEVVAVVAASGSDVTSANAAAIDVLTRYAARCLEAMTAFKTARAVSGGAAGGHSDAADEEDASARRYARLLVSEIKLYHEPAVIEGRRDRDLAARLGGEIARARALYEERVPPHVRRRADHFRDELVRTLANGDASLLQLS